MPARVSLRLKVQEKAFLDSFENFIDVDLSSPDVIRAYPKYYDIELTFGISPNRAKRIILEQVVYKEQTGFNRTFVCMGAYLLRDKTEEEKEGGITKYKIRYIQVAIKKAIINQLIKELEEFRKENPEVDL